MSNVILSNILVYNTDYVTVYYRNDSFHINSYLIDYSNQLDNLDEAIKVANELNELILQTMKMPKILGRYGYKIAYQANHLKYSNGELISTVKHDIEFISDPNIGYLELIEYLVYASQFNEAGMDIEEFDRQVKELESIQQLPEFGNNEIAMEYFKHSLGLLKPYKGILSPHLPATAKLYHTENGCVEVHQTKATDITTANYRIDYVPYSISIINSPNYNDISEILSSKNLIEVIAKLNPEIKISSELVVTEQGLRTEHYDIITDTEVYLFPNFKLEASVKYSLNFTN